MDGDLAPLEELADLKARFDALLLVDEAHAIGVFGPAGGGVAQMLGLDDKIDVAVGTLSKSIGAIGGFVAGRRELIDVIKNTGRAYVYTTALPPAVCAAALEGLRIIRDQPQRRTGLLATARWMHQELTRAGFKTGDSASQIIPLMVGRAGVSVRLSEDLLNEGFLVPAIRPPTVPPNTSRLRLSLSAGLQRDDLERFMRVLSALGAKGGIFGQGPAR